MLDIHAPWVRRRPGSEKTTEGGPDRFAAWRPSTIAWCQRRSLEAEKTGALGLLIAVILRARAAVRAFLGWPPFRDLPQDVGLGAGADEALAIGWPLGSRAKVAHAALVLRPALGRLQGKVVESLALWILALLCTRFGTAAFILHDFNPHFLFFIATGLHLGLFSAISRRYPGRGEEVRLG